MSMFAARNEKELLLNQLELGATGTIGCGSTDAFSCVEMDMVVSEVQRVKEWKHRGGTIIGIKVGDDSILLDSLSQVLVDACDVDGVYEVEEEDNDDDTLVLHKAPEKSERKASNDYVVKYGKHKR
ncbi:hypothetical protein Tco_1215899 [Tanacetum coccineum]